MPQTKPEDLETTIENVDFQEPPSPPVEKKGAAGLLLVDPSQYELQKELGQGGMGRVMRAHDQRLHREVAIKELLPTSREAIPRFIREALVTAKLQHPSILPIYEIGRWPSGKPFYSMKLIQGKSLGESIAKQESLETRLALIPRVLDACEAMAYAHAEGIIHRDLKPDNIMLGGFGETIVIDWGLAKEIADKTPDDPSTTKPTRDGTPPKNSPQNPNVTAAGHIVGTPAYMPLEQAHGQSLDARADVYSLGAILYETLSGQAPYSGKSTEEVLLTLHQQAPIPLQSLAPRAPKELLAIVSKAMSRNKEARYPTAKELANDLRRFQEGQLVAAYQYTTGEKFRRWVNQHKTTLALSTAAILALLTMGVVSHFRISKERDRAVEAQQKESIARKGETARADELLLLQAQNELRRDPVAALEWLTKLSQGSPRWRQARIIAADANERGLSSVLATDEGPINDIAASPDGEWLASASDGLQLQNLSQTKTISLNAHQAQLSRVVFSADGKWLASGDESGLVVRWDVACVLKENSDKCRVLFAGHQDQIWDLAFSPDGKWLASASKDKTLRLWGEEQKVCYGHDRAVRKVLFASDGGWLASASDDDTLRIWEPSRCDETSTAMINQDNAVSVLKGHTGEVQDFVITSNNQTIYSVSQDQTLRSWNVASKRDTLLFRDQNALYTVALSSDNQQLAAASDAGKIFLFEVSSLQAKSKIKADPIDVLASNKDKPHRPQSPRPDEIIDNAPGRPDELGGGSGTGTGSGKGLGGSIRPGEFFEPDRNPETPVANAGTETPVKAKVQSTITPIMEEIPGHTDAVLTLAFSKDNKILVSSSRDKNARVYSLGQKQSQLLVGHQDRITQAIFIDGEKKLITSSWDHTIRRWNIEEQQKKQFKLPEGFTSTLSWVEAGEKRLLIGAAKTRLYLWDVSSPTPKMVENNALISSFTVSPNGAKIAVGGVDGSLRVYQSDKLSAALWSDPKQNTKTIEHLAFTTDGQLLASADNTKGIWLWANGKGARVSGMDSAATSLAFSADGVWLAAADQAGNVYLWSTRDQNLQTIKAHTGYVHAIAFSKEANLLASAGEDQSLCLFSLSKPLECQRLSGHSLGVRALAFSSDGKLLLSGGFDRTVRLWDLSKKTSVEWQGHKGKINALSFLHNNQEAISIGADNTAFLWDVASGQKRALHTDAAQLAVTVSRDEESLFVLSQDGLIRRFEDDVPFEESALRQWITENISK
jgi:WD40 repeat protein/serine/threonine protein kinase